VSTEGGSARRARLLVLLSGSGRTMVNLAERCADGRLEAEIAGVIASRACAGVDRAVSLGLPVEVVPGEIPGPELATRASRAGADWVVLAGYLRRVEIPTELQGRVVNIHPALLPGDGTGGRFGGPGMYGTRVHEAVLAAGERESGCTVHLCDAAYDAGPVVLRRSCPVEPDDTAETLAQRVFGLELEAYPEALQLLIESGRTSP
jgi:phosphoribosylglycinamide formyltransferase-1